MSRDVANNLFSKLTTSKQPVCTPPINSTDSYAVADTGATGHFMLIKTILLHLRKASNPISVRLPNGTAIQSTHQGLLPLAMLPEAARKAHILPGLASHSLISIAQLCDNGCTAFFDKEQCHIIHNRKTILKGPRCPKTKLWLLPTNNMIHMINLMVTTEGETHHKQVTTKGEYTQDFCNNAYQQKTTKELLQYLHAAAFSPTTETWKKP